MGALVFIIPIAYFAVIGLVATLLFGAVLPWVANAPHPAWLAWLPWDAEHLWAVSPWFAALLKLAILALGVVMALAGVLTWMERRQSALLQDRLGPNRAHIGPIKAFGLMHFVADALKMLFKEDFIPAKANRGLFALAPILAIAPVFIVIAILPWGAGVVPGHLGDVLSDEQFARFISAGDGVRFQAVHLEVGMLFYFAITSLAVYGTTLAGWASYNKWSLLGGLRASSQMMSYEVTMGLAILGTFLVAGSLEPSRIVEFQGDNPLRWGVVLQPLGFLLFFTAAIAETKRAPFDIPEGESEIVGYFVEYSGLRFGMFYLAEFAEVAAAAAIITTMFFGGYHFPGLHENGFAAFADASSWLAWLANLPHWVVAVLHVTVFGFKVFFLCWFQLMVRWTVPRFRPDQLMALGWKGLLPLSIVNILITAGVVLALNG